MLSKQVNITVFMHMQYINSREGMASWTEHTLPPLVIKQLNDKMYEKRKSGALEIEKILKDYAAKEDFQSIEQIIVCLGKEFANAPTAQPRNGGLIGLAACAIALGKHSSKFTEKLVKPALACFTDPDNRVRYFACEALYNICKVSRGSVLTFFNEIFDGLSKLADDTDTNVRNGSQLLDVLMKDIVSESGSFNIPSFIPLLRDRIYTKKPFCRRFVVCWVCGCL
ncbi:VAC14 [Bugula neritina]|uniref:VAC14 n=1 Tax=Bugula neritina TaxID=10212 RepID=A0A7J7JLX2_BUGNE|nr:VAC14 [Bugula neritina]KAF6037293.1 VAC14 [Bugula neritina]